MLGKCVDPLYGTENFIRFASSKAKNYVLSNDYIKLRHLEYYNYLKPPNRINPRKMPHCNELNDLQPTQAQLTDKRSK